jgi:hypothetical protein
MEALIEHEWVRLKSGFDVMLEHGIPCRISNNKLPIPESPKDLQREILQLTGLHVSIGQWVPGEGAGELEAPLTVEKSELQSVLERLALYSAAVFVDRFNRAINQNDPDWDETAYHEDFVRALKYCGLDWGEVKPQACYERYRITMEQETAKLAYAG